MKKLFLGILWIAASLQAGIEWRQQEITLQVHPAQTVAETDFCYTNSGSDVIAFSNVEITCSCLAAQPLTSPCAPGESGKLTVLFNLRGRTGPQRRTVVVHTSDGGQARLTLLADIPEAYVAEPKMMYWTSADPVEEQRFQLRNPNAMPIKLLSVSSSHEGLPAELKTIREGFEYEIVVVRKSAEQKIRSVIRVAMEPPPGQTEAKTLNLYVLVK